MTFRELSRARVRAMGFEQTKERDAVTEPIIGAAIEVHRHLGPGLLESAYEACLCYELRERGLTVQNQVRLPVIYKGQALDCDFRIDILLPGLVVVEVKAVAQVIPIHEAQLLTYMKLARISTGLLINFNVSVLKDGITRRKL
jgi:GxxExxY protein